jgi:hypothetical protein
MTVWVLRNGRLVEKDQLEARACREVGSLPLPMISRIEPFESPVTGAEITSWRARDRDMAAVDAVDPRDFPAGHFNKRGRAKEPSNG